MGKGDYRDKCLQVHGDECIVCESSESIEVHHIDGDRANNDISNLVPLCQEHHNEVHTESLKTSYIEEWKSIRDFEEREQDSTERRSGWARINFRAPGTLLDEVDDFADERGTNRSHALRELIGEGLDDQDQDTVDRATVNLLKVETNSLHDMVESLEDENRELRQRLKSVHEDYKDIVL